MPVTFAPATTDSVDAPAATSRDVPPLTADHLLSASSCASTDGNTVPAVVRSSIGGRPGPDDTQFKIAPGPGNGFVDTLLSAYIHHHALVIRPDEVWLAVVSQFSFYTAAAQRNSAKSKSLAVEISISPDDTAAPPDAGKFSRRITRLLQKTVPDANLRDWLVPAFSTTTPTDVLVSALLVLCASCVTPATESAAQKRRGSDAHDVFRASGAGIPRVTLEGEREDWEALLARLEQLRTADGELGVGLPVVAWYHFLHPVLSHFVGAFDDPGGAETREFWGRAVFGKDESNEGKNADKLSGWITAFCAFSPDGAWLGPELIAASATGADAPEKLTAAEFWSTHTHYTAPAAAEKPKPKPKGKKGKKMVRLDLIEESPAPAPAPTITLALADVPPANASALLALTLSIRTRRRSEEEGEYKYESRREKETKEARDYTVLAGLIGTGFSSSRDTQLSTTGRNDTVRPVVAWWIYEHVRISSSNGARKKRERVKPAKEEGSEDVPVPPPRVQFDLGEEEKRELVGNVHVDGEAQLPPEKEGSEHVAVVPAPPAQFDFDLGTGVGREEIRESEPALMYTAVTHLDGDAEVLLTPPDIAVAHVDRSPEPEPVPAPVQQSSSWGLELDSDAPTVPVPEPPAHLEPLELTPPATSAPHLNLDLDLGFDAPVVLEPPTQSQLEPLGLTPPLGFNDVHHSDAGAKGAADSVKDVEADAGGWDSISWSTPAPEPVGAPTVGLGFGFGSSPSSGFGSASRFGFGASSGFGLSAGAGSGFDFGATSATSPAENTQGETELDLDAFGSSAEADFAVGVQEPNGAPAGAAEEAEAGAPPAKEPQHTEEAQQQPSETQAETETPAPADDPAPPPVPAVEPDPDAAPAVETPAPEPEVTPAVEAPPAGEEGDGEDGDGDDAAQGAKSGGKNANAGGGGKGGAKKGKKKKKGNK